METLKETTELYKPRLASELYDRPALEQKAWYLINNRQRIEHDSWQQEPEINARTAIFEELTAKGHLSVVESDEPADVANQRTLIRLVNGWSNNLPDYERERRFYEIVEELTIQKVWADIKAGNLPADTLVITISNIPRDRTNDLLTLSRMGYGVLNDKGMVRGTGFENGVRVVEQISRSNSNDGSAEQLFGSLGYVVGRGSQRILRSQIIAKRSDFPNGIVDVQRALDSLAGPNIIYGEDRNKPGLNVPAYEDLREVSRAREEQAEDQINRLAQFERELNMKYQAGQITYDQKLRAFNLERKKLVNEICILDPSYAKDARGAAAAPHFEAAAVAMAAGNDTVGVQQLEIALAKADPRAGAVCGGDGKALEQLSKANAQEAELIYLRAKEAREKWKWTRGVCVVKECPTRPRKVEVGPCSVCRNCQKIFDKGGNPSKVYKIDWLELIAQPFREDMLRHTADQEAKKAKRAQQQLKKAA